MRITVDYKRSKMQALKVISATYLTDFTIRIGFSDGLKKVVNFKPFLSQTTNPYIKKYLDENEFSKFKINNGNLNWNDYDLIFPIWDLYRGKISA